MVAKKEKKTGPEKKQNAQNIKKFPDGEPVWETGARLIVSFCEQVRYKRSNEWTVSVRDPLFI
jgi:hypothetical protein